MVSAAEGIPRIYMKLYLKRHNMADMMMVHHKVQSLKAQYNQMLAMFNFINGDSL